MMYADMICDVMPPIPEDTGGHDIDHESMETEIGEEAEANIEQLMVSMLEERDKVRDAKHISFVFTTCNLVTRKTS